MPTPWLGQAADPSGSAAERENVGLLHQAVHAFSHASSASRFDFLTALVRHCSVRELSQLEGAIVPRLKVDFLQRLPLEVALHILAYIDEPAALTRAAAVSRTWNRLANDEYLWSAMCEKFAYNTPERMRWLLGCLWDGDGSVHRAHSMAVDDDTSVTRRVRRRSLPGDTACVSLRAFFRLSYATGAYFWIFLHSERNWIRGGRLLARYTSQSMADVDPDPNRRLALTCCAIDENWIVVGMSNRMIFVFSAQTGQLVRELSGHDSGVWCLMLVRGIKPCCLGFLPPPSSELLEVSRDTKPRARLHPAPEGLALEDAACVAQRSAATDLACARTEGWGRPDTYLLSAGSDRLLCMWNMTSGVCEKVLRGHTSTIRCIEAVAGRPVAVTGSRDGTLRVWDLENGRVVHVLAGHQHSVRCLAIADGTIASGSYDYTCRLWDLETGRCLHVLKGHQLQIYSVAFNGQYVVTGSSDSTVRVWDAASGVCLAVFQGYTHVVSQLQLHGDILATGSSDGRVILFSLTTFECLYRVCAHDSGVTTMQFNDRHLVTGGSDGLAKLWDAKTGRFVRLLCEPCENVWAARFVEDKCVILCKRHGRCTVDIVSFLPEDSK